MCNSQNFLNITNVICSLTYKAWNYGAGLNKAENVRNISVSFLLRSLIVSLRFFVKSILHPYPATYTYSYHFHLYACYTTLWTFSYRINFQISTSLIYNIFYQKTFSRYFSKIFFLIRVISTFCSVSEMFNVFIQNNNSFFWALTLMISIVNVFFECQWRWTNGFIYMFK